MDSLGIFLRRQAGKLLKISIQQLREGIISRLSQKYTSFYGEEKAFHLSIATLNRCLLEEPSDMESKIFNQNHSELIEYELKKLSQDDSVSKAVSYLFAAEIMCRKAGTAKSSTKQLHELAEQAAKLKIKIPDKKDICGNSDLNDCVIELMKFATAFYKDGLITRNNTD